MSVRLRTNLQRNRLQKKNRFELKTHWLCRIFKRSVFEMLFKWVNFFFVFLSALLHTTSMWCCMVCEMWTHICAELCEQRSTQPYPSTISFFAFYCVPVHCAVCGFFLRFSFYSAFFTGRNFPFFCCCFNFAISYSVLVCILYSQFTLLNDLNASLIISIFHNTIYAGSRR